MAGTPSIRLVRESVGPCLSRTSYKYAIGPEMVREFRPPPVNDLAKVDVAGCQYSPDVVEIMGVVSHSSQGGWPRCDDYEVHCFELAAWRRVGSPLAKAPLTILRPVSSVGGAFKDYQKGSIHGFQVKLSSDESRAVFVKPMKPVSDSELEALAVELAKPIVVHTERFGPLTLDRRVNWFEGQAEWNGQIVALRIEPDSNLDLVNQLKTADALFGNSVQWGEQIKRFAVEEKLALASDWQEREVSEEEFLQRMRLESISIQPEGQFEFWHDDGDLFWGHSIQITGSLKDGLTGSDIPG